MEKCIKKECDNVQGCPGLQRNLMGFYNELIQELDSFHGAWDIPLRATGGTLADIDIKVSPISATALGDVSLVYLGLVLSVT